MKGIFIDLKTAKKLAQLDKLKKQMEVKKEYEIIFKRNTNK